MKRKKNFLLWEKCSEIVKERHMSFSAKICLTLTKYARTSLTYSQHNIVLICKELSRYSHNSSPMHLGWVSVYEGKKMSSNTFKIPSECWIYQNYMQLFLNFFDTDFSPLSQISKLEWFYDFYCYFPINMKTFIYYFFKVWMLKSIMFK